MLEVLKILPLELNEPVVNEVVFCPGCRQIRPAHEVVHEVIMYCQNVLICDKCYALVTTLTEDGHQTEDSDAVQLSE